MRRRRAVRVEVACTELPGSCFKDPYDPGSSERRPVYLGVQRGREVVEQVRADAPDVTFAPEFELVKRPDGTVDFRGPFAQGRPGARFFYLSWGVKDEAGRFVMFRRLKVPLHRLDPTALERAIEAGRPIRVRLRLTDDKGGPLCGTPPPTHMAWQMPE